MRGLTQQQAADKLCVQASALSNWERGTRDIPADLDQIDRALDGDHVLADLLWAYGAPDGLEPGKTWSKVFPGSTGPVWLWIRSSSPVVKFEGEWGVARAEVDLELGPNGAFITVGASVPDSPAIVNLSEPGWAAFGRGELPAEMPGAPVLPIVTLVEPSSATGTFMQLFRNNMISQVAARSRGAANLARQVPRHIARFLTGPTRLPDHDRSPRSWPPPQEGAEGVERLRFARLRLARGLSLIELAELLEAETGLEVSRDTLRRFEAGIGRPHHRMLPVALDHVLGAEGRLVALPVRSAQGDGVVSFPRYWSGPVWVELDDVPSGTKLVLQRGKWLREVEVDRSTTYSFHWFDSAIPLRITIEAEMRWTAGVGCRAGTQPIDQNWAPATIDVAQDAVSTTELAITTALARVPNPATD